MSDIPKSRDGFPTARELPGSAVMWPGPRRLPEPLHEKEDLRGVFEI